MKKNDMPLHKFLFVPVEVTKEYSGYRSWVLKKKILSDRPSETKSQFSSKRLSLIWLTCWASAEVFPAVFSRVSYLTESLRF